MSKITKDEFPGVFKLQEVLKNSNVSSIPRLGLQSNVLKDLPEEIMDIAQVVHDLSSIDSEKFDTLCSEIAQHIEESTRT